MNHNVGVWLTSRRRDGLGIHREISYRKPPQKGTKHLCRTLRALVRYQACRVNYGRLVA